MKELSARSFGEFIQHIQPDPFFVTNTWKEFPSSIRRRYKEELQAGYRTDTKVFEYDGDYTVGDLINWLVQFDRLEGTSTDYEGGLSVQIEEKIPLTREEIVERQEWLVNNPETEAEPIKWRKFVPFSIGDTDESI